MPKRRQRRDTPVADEHVSETDLDDVESVVEDENDENTPINDENAFSHITYAPVHRSSSVLAFGTPLSHSRSDHDTALRDITDQFFHPPSPSPVRISRLKRAAPHHSIEPPRRPKKPKSLAYPADPPNWLYSRSSSSLPPSSPLPPSTSNIDHAHLTVGPPPTTRYEYHLDTPSKTSDSDPFGFVAVERALKSKQAPKAKRAPHKPVLRISSVKSPPRSTVLAVPSHTPVSFSQLVAPVPTNNEDIEGLYADEPVAGPSHVHVPAAPLLMMNSDQPYVGMDPTGSEPTFADPLRTPRKRQRRVSPILDQDPDLDEQSSVPSSPSPVKVSVGMSANRHASTARSSDLSILKATHAKSRGKPPSAHVSRTKHVKKSYQDIPTPSSTPASAHRSSRQSTAPPTPVLPRRSTRKAVVGARTEPRGTTSNGENGHGGSRIKLRSGNIKVTTETKTTRSTPRAKNSPSKSKPRTRTQNTTRATTKPARGRPKGKSNTKNKGKGRALENVLEMSDGTRETYEIERRERLEYFKRLEGYQIQKENVYVV